MPSTAIERTGAARAAESFAPLVDPRFGLIRRLRVLPRRPEMPSCLFYARAEMADSSRFCPWHSDDRSAGYAWDSPAAARAAAAGEAVERYCGNLVPADLRRACFEELAGEPAVDPEGLALFAAEQYATPGFPFVPFHRRLPVLWTRGRSMVEGGPVWVPASLVWVTFFTGDPTRREPPTHAVPYAGIATGTERAGAEVGALLELLERDAASLAWHRGDRLPRVEVPGWLRAKVQAPAVDLRFYSFPSDFGVPVLGALAHDLDRDLIALGLAARADAAAAALKAAAEAYQLLTTSRILDDPQNPYMQRVAAGAPGLGVKPWRRDRSYRRLYRDDWRDAWDLLCHLQLHQDPDMRQPLSERLEGGGSLPLEALPSLGCAESDAGEVRAAIVRRLSEAGHGPVSVDVTTAEVRAQGLVVVRVLAPGLYGNTPAAFPYLGGPRLASAREAGRVCSLPMPYA